MKTLRATFTSLGLNYREVQEPRDLEPQVASGAGNDRTPSDAPVTMTNTAGNYQVYYTGMGPTHAQFNARRSNNGRTTHKGTYPNGGAQNSGYDGMGPSNDQSERKTTAPGSRNDGLGRNEY